MLFAAKHGIEQDETHRMHARLIYLINQGAGACGGGQMIFLGTSDRPSPVNQYHNRRWQSRDWAMSPDEVPVTCRITLGSRQG